MAIGVDNAPEPVNAQDAAPRRSPGLIQRVLQKVIYADPQMGPQPELENTTSTGTTGESVGKRFDQYFRSGFDRKSVYFDVSEMDNVSEEVSVALDTIADNTVASEDGQMQSCKVISKSMEVQNIVDQMFKDTHLHERLYSWVRSNYKYGDLFVEIVVNENLEITKLRMLPPKTMNRNEDAGGDLLLGMPKFEGEGVDRQCLNKPEECAFEQIEPDTERITATFLPYQILHLRWNWDGIDKYGQSGLRVTRIGWKKLHAEEEALIMGRLVRAMMKLAFYVDTTGKTKPEKDQILQDFQAQIMKKTTVDGRKDTPWSVLSDFFFSADHYKVGGQVVESKTRVEAIDPKNDGLTHIDDIEYFHRKSTSTTRVPRSYLGFDKDSPAAGTVSMQDIQYVRVLRRIQSHMSAGLHTLIDMALILQDLDPTQESNAYEIEWPTLSTVNEGAAAQAAYQLAQAGALWLGTSSLNQTPVVDPEWIMKNLLDMNDDEIATQLTRNQKAATEKASQQQAQMDMQTAAVVEQHRQQAQTRAQFNPPAPNAPKEGGHQKQDGNPEKTAQGANTSQKTTTQEVDGLVKTIVQEVSGRINPEVDRIAREQHASMGELANLSTTIGHLPKNGNGNHG